MMEKTYQDCELTGFNEKFIPLSSGDATLVARGDRQVADDQRHRVSVAGGGEVVADREEYLAEHRLAEDPCVERVVVRRCVAGLGGDGLVVEAAEVFGEVAKQIWHGMCPVNIGVRLVRDVSRLGDRGQNCGHVVNSIRSGPGESEERASSTTSGLGRPWSQTGHLCQKLGAQGVIELHLKGQRACPCFGAGAWCVGRVVLDRGFCCGGEHAERGSQHVELEIGVSRYAEWPTEWERNPQRSGRSHPFGLFTNEAD